MVTWLGCVWVGYVGGWLVAWFVWWCGGGVLLFVVCLAGFVLGLAALLCLAIVGGVGLG